MYSINNSNQTILTIPWWILIKILIIAGWRNQFSRRTKKTNLALTHCCSHPGLVQHPVWTQQVLAEVVHL